MYERLLDKGAVPTVTQLILYCGINGSRFSDLNDFLFQRFNTSSEIRFPYGKNYGWSVTHRKGKKLICDIFAEADSFTVMLRLTDERFMSIYSELSEHTQSIIDNRYPCGNGGWIHYRVTDDESLRDIKRLLEVKCTMCK